MNRRIRGLAVASALVFATATAISAGPAGAATDTFTTITSPKGPGQTIYPFPKVTGGNLATPLTVAGSVSPDIKAGGTGLDIFCMVHADTRSATGNTPLNSSLIAVNNDNTFSGSIVSATLPCSLKALPHGETTFDADGNVVTGNSYFAAYSGPSVYNGGFAALKASGRTIAGETLIFNKRAVVVYVTVDIGGIAAAAPWNDFGNTAGSIPEVNSPPEGSLGVSGANLVPAAGTPSHSSIVIDGHQVYAPATLSAFVPAPQQSTVPNIVITHSRNLTTGEGSQSESDPLSWCNGNAYPQDSGTPTCVVKSAGVTFKRTIVSSHQAAVATVRESFVSTNHKKHVISVEYQNFFASQDNGRVGFMLPGQSQFSTPTANTTVNSLPAGPHTIFVASDLHAADGSPQRSDLGVTYSVKPQLFWATSSVFGLRYANKVIPANGAFHLGFSEQFGFSMPSVRPLATAEQKAMAEKLTITSPKNGATVSTATTTVKGTITNPVNGLPAKVTVSSGGTSKTVPVHADGTFTAALALSAGKHTITVKATDPAGDKLSSSVHVKHT